VALAVIGALVIPPITEPARAQNTAKPAAPAAAKPATPPAQQPAQQPAAQSGSKPNILVIFGDDIGQSNISAYTHGLVG
jgi:arylsulfatase